MTENVAITVGTVSPPKFNRDGRTMVVSIPISMRRTGGRKKVITPASAAPWAATEADVNHTLVKALARAHRWREMLESGMFTSLRDLAKAENINEVYLGRVLRLTLLSPKITEAILSGHQREGLELAELLKPFPIDWAHQDSVFVAERSQR